MNRLVLALILALQPAAVLAQSSSLVRLTGRDDLLGWEAVGRLDVAGTGFCTGTLIAPDQVLTAAHCVFDPVTGAALDAAALTFRAGLRDGEAIAERAVARIAVHPDYAPRSGMATENVRRDVALLQLTTPIPQGDADPFVLFRGTPTGSEVSVVSYGRGRAEALSRQRSCQVLGVDQGLIAFDCDVTFGSSGAPVFAREGTRGRILSIVSGGTADKDRPVSFGMTLPDIVSDLKARLRAPVPRPAGQIRRIGINDGQSGIGAKFVRSGGS